MKKQIVSTLLALCMLAAGENVVDVRGGVITGGTGYPIQLYSNYVYDGGGVYIAPGGQLTMTCKSIFSG